MRRLGKEDRDIEKLLRRCVKASMLIDFKYPEKLDEYVERTEREKALIKEFDEELRQLDQRILRPIDKSYTRKSWEIFSNLLARIHRERIFQPYRDRLFYIARRIILKDFIAENSEGSYR